MAVAEDAREAALAMLARREPKTICPSKVARALAAAPGVSPSAEDWRNMMPLVHQAVDRLLDEKRV